MKRDEKRGKRGIEGKREKRGKGKGRGRGRGGRAERQERGEEARE